ncbi:MAG: PilN domain-containing protein [Thermodesulfovibrionales bacterium]
MIRVNLLQVKRKKKAKPLPAFVVLGVIMAVLTGMAVGFVFIGQSKKIDSLNSIKIANQNKINELKQKVKEVDDFEAKIKQFEMRKKVITDLRKNQSLPVKVMNEISAQLADGVWLGEMKVKKTSVTIKGYAFTNSNVVEFINNLKRSSLFSGVYLVESKESSKGGKSKVSVYEFKLQFVIQA